MTKDDAPWLDCMDGFKYSQEPYPDAMFEEAERRESENKALEALDKLHEENSEGMKQLAEGREKYNEALKLAIDGIGKYSDALKELAETEKVELRAELEKKKKENFELVATSCMKEYEEKYQRDVFPVDESWVYMVAEYGATGEGNTTCLYLTQANARADDFSEDNRYVPINSKQYRAVRAFHEKFGTWMLHGLRFLSKEDFYQECAYFIPPVMMKLSNAKCFKEFYTEVHYNFS